MLRLIYVTLISIFLLASSGCGDDFTEVPTLEEYFLENNLNPQQSASGLYYTIFDEGEGEKADFSKFVVIDFSQFDLNNDRLGGTMNTAFPAALQMSTINIQGLVEGLGLLGVGGRANLYVPVSLAGANSLPLIYAIEVVDIYDSLSDYNDSEIEKHLEANELTATRMDNGMYVIIEEPGDEAKPDISSTVTVDYHGYFLNGDVFDSSVDRGAPATFGLNAVIQGWQLGIPLFGEGGKGKIFIPSNLAYGTAGNTAIPPNYPIAFDVELVDIAN